MGLLQSLSLPEDNRKYYWEIIIYVKAIHQEDNLRRGLLQILRSLPEDNRKYYWDIIIYVEAIHQEQHCC